MACVDSWETCASVAPRRAASNTFQGEKTVAGLRSAADMVGLFVGWNGHCKTRERQAWGRFPTGLSIMGSWKPAPRRSGMRVGPRGDQRQRHGGRPILGRNVLRL